MQKTREERKIAKTQESHRTKEPNSAAKNEKCSPERATYLYSYMKKGFRKNKRRKYNQFKVDTNNTLSPKQQNCQQRKRIAPPMGKNVEKKIELNYG